MQNLIILNPLNINKKNAILEAHAFYNFFVRIIFSHLFINKYVSLLQKSN
jgi:hypothetical protein